MLKGEKIGQGRENAKIYLEKNPKSLHKKLNQQSEQKAGLISKRLKDWRNNYWTFNHASKTKEGGKSPNIFFEDVMDKDDDFFDKCLEGFAMFTLNQGKYVLAQRVQLYDKEKAIARTSC